MLSPLALPLYLLLSCRCELRDPTGGCVSDVAWNPDQGLHLVTSSGDDKNPVLKLWDLRSSTSLPLATLQGENRTIVQVQREFWEGGREGGREEGREGGGKEGRKEGEEGGRKEGRA